MQELKKEEITRKLDLVVNKLLTLGGPENETELENGGESIGFFPVISESANGTGRRASAYTVSTRS